MESEIRLELSRLREENTRLKALLAKHGILYEQQTPNPELKTSYPELSLEQKVALFRSLFCGREDVFARRWHSTATKKSGYQPVCLKEWDREYCDKKKYKCAECPNHDFKSLGYEDIYKHLEGKDPNGRDVIGAYAILKDHTCRFLCCDFDDKSCEHGFEDDVKAYVAVCEEWSVPAYIERSRSGNGAHVWILFSEPVLAKMARILGNVILTEAMRREGRISFRSYDRFFPSQDYLPDGGFGNLVALPLQGQARRKGNSVFVNKDFNVIEDQWGYLTEMVKLTTKQVDVIVSAHCHEDPIGQFSKSSDSAPWERPASSQISKSDLQRAVAMVRSSGIFIPISGLPAGAVNHIKRIAAFKNPEFYRNLGMRLPTYNIPRIISCSDISDDYLIMPRGCENAVREFFATNGVDVVIDDKTTEGEPIDVTFNGELRHEQLTAVEALSQRRCGTLHAATAFGKTVTAAALIARRKVNTLILVHTKALLEQWRQRLEEYLITGFHPNESAIGRGRKKKFHQFGALSSSESTLNGKIDIALLQSCISDNEVKPLLRNYGMVIVDECHHAPAVNFERVLKDVTVRYVYGLTATPIRKDGHQPIIFMQCGEICFTSDSQTQSLQQQFQRLLVPRFTSHRTLSADGVNYNQVIDELIEDEQRNRLIIEDVKNILEEGRSPIILTGRTAHVDLLVERCREVCPNVIRLVGNDSAKTKHEVMAKLTSIAPNEKLIVVATGKYVGEGFDLPRLDTLMLALPVSWKGLITQYAGRLHRDYPGKTQVCIYDYVDIRVPICESMYRKRIHGYKSIGYSVATYNEGLFAEPKIDSIYDNNNFERPFHNDLSEAKRSIVIATYRLKWKQMPKVIDLLCASILHGIRVRFIISEVGHHEQELQSMGFDIVHRPVSKMNCAVIDRRIGWYGGVNLIGRAIADATVIRMNSSEFADALLAAVENFEN